jgi:phosphoesterase RecJ-like protein
MQTEFIQKLNQLLDKSKKIVIFPHKNPDGDALGSTLALSRFLIKKGHQCHVISPNEYPSFLGWLPDQEKILRYSENTNECNLLIQSADIAFTLDFNSLGRIGSMSEVVKELNVPIVMIDHHQAPEEYAKLKYSDTTIGSTCEMVYNVLAAIDKKAIDVEIAQCIYTGIMTDSGSFRFSSTSSKTHRIVAELLDLGVNHALIHQKIYDSYRFERLQLLGITLKKLTRIDNLPVVYTYLTQEELDSCDFKKGDTEGFVNYGLSLEYVKLAVILIENKQEKIIKMSFRSKDNFDVNTFARNYFNGGGHFNAAGGISNESMEKTIVLFREAIIKNSSLF